MSTDTNHHDARITPVESGHANRVLNRWSLLRNFVVTQTLGFLYGVACCLLPLLATQFFADAVNAGFEATLGLILLSTLCGAAAAMIGLNLYGFPSLLIDRRICRRFLKTIKGRADSWISPSEAPPRVVEWVPRERWRKRLCLDTAIDLMIIQVDQRGVWMMGDRYQYELPAESILGAELEGFRPPCCSFEIYMVTIIVRTKEGPIELPISYRDYRWSELRGSRRRLQAMNLVEQINAAARGELFRPPRPPSVDDAHEHLGWQPSNNPYAAPALVDE